MDQHTALYGVIGYPLGHTLSPVMHNTALAEMGMNAVYLAFETKDLAGCVHGMKALDIKGMSVTLPYKSAVIPLLDQVEALAGKIGAVNTIVNREGRLTGYNTDGMAAVRALEERMELPGKTCLLVGAGGTARAIGFILRESGVRLVIANRTPDRGEALARELRCPFVLLKDAGEIRSDLLIQTTPVGMYPQEDQCILSPDILKEGTVVMDIIYNPLETKLLRMARDRGCLTINGLPMFIYQGAEQFKLWFGLEAPVRVMTRAVKEALRNPR